MTDLDRLERLSQLRTTGALSDAEYEQEKAKLLGGRASSHRPWIMAGIVAALLAVAFIVFLITRQTSDDIAQANLSIPSPIAPASSSPTPSPSPSPAAANEPDLPPGRGRMRAADPIAQSPAQATGMKPDTTLNVAGKRIVLYRPANDEDANNQYVLMVGGRGEVLEDGSTFSITTVGNYVILEIDSGGTACPAEFRIVDVAAGRITRSFGTCSDLINNRIASDGALISVVHSFNVGGPVTARYAKGVLTTWDELSPAE